MRSERLTGLGVSIGPRFVLVALADHADRDNEAWPSQETLALETGMSELGVRKALAVLVERGLVEILDRGGPRRSARYRLRVDPDLRATR